jgi:two-component system sensor histidine kinase KdpD
VVVALTGGSEGDTLIRRAVRIAARTKGAELNAVSHDLRTPLASAKAAVGTLRISDLPLTDEDRAELLAAAEESLDRLSVLVETCST